MPNKWDTEFIFLNIAADLLIKTLKDLQERKIKVDPLIMADLIKWQEIWIDYTNFF